MNVRLSKNEVRFRITKEEAETLCATKTLSTSTEFPKGERIIYDIFLTEQENSNSCNALTLKFADNRITLAIGNETFAYLKSEASAKDGVHASQSLLSGEQVNYSLQIDVFKRQR